MEILAALVGGAIGLLGAFAGVWLANRFEREKTNRETRKQNTLALYVEYHAPEMLGARIKARKVLAENQERERIWLLPEIYQNVGMEEWYSISLVITFFEKYGILMKNEQLDQRLARELLGRDLKYWYDHFLHNLMVEDGDVDSYWATAINYARDQVESEFPAG